VSAVRTARRPARTAVASRTGRDSQHDRGNRGRPPGRPAPRPVHRSPSGATTERLCPRSREEERSP